MKQQERSGKRLKSDLGSIICERTHKGPALDDLVVSREINDSKLEQDCEKRFKLISAKFDEENVRAGIRLAATDDTVAPFDNNTYEKIRSKHPFDPQIMPNKMSKIAQLRLSPQSRRQSTPLFWVFGRIKRTCAPVVQRPYRKEQRPIGKEFPQQLTSVLNIVLEVLRPYFFDDKLVGLG